MSSHVSPITYEILVYLVEHPDAEDTLEGIIERWLLEPTIEPHLTKVKAALDGLVAQGLVLERKDKEACSYYKLNRRRLSEVAVLLKSKD